MAPPDKVRCWVDDMFEQAPRHKANIAAARTALAGRVQKRSTDGWMGDPGMAISSLVSAAKGTAACAIGARQAPSHRREAIKC
jgi:hypothetical protein